eukprot:7336309-Prymnesium_polylepis.1
MSRRVRQHERARLGGTTSGAAPTAVAARAAATRHTAAAVIEHFDWLKYNIYGLGLPPIQH